jgi:hypothetical protein
MSLKDGIDFLEIIGVRIVDFVRHKILGFNAAHNSSWSDRKMAHCRSN